MNPDISQQPETPVAPVSPARKRLTPQPLASTDAFRFEKDVPLPGQEVRSFREPLYPVMALKEGESFSWPIIKGRETKQYSSANYAAKNEIRKHPNKRFTIRILKSDGVLRCWRMKDAVPGEEQP